MKSTLILASLLLVSVTGFVIQVHASQIQPYQSNAALYGRLTSDPACVVKDGRKNAQVWVSIGQILLYQVEVPTGGTYEFHLVPGKYDLVATNAKGCMAQTQFTVIEKQVAQVDLKLIDAKPFETKVK